jgi:perosamine synthetase
VSDFARHQSSKVVIEKYFDVGYNYRMSDLHAAIGIQQLRRLEYILTRRRQVAERYNKAFAGLDGVRLPFTSSDTPHTYQSYMVTLLPGASKTRDELMIELLAAGIQTRRGVMAIHLEPCYSQHRKGLPVTETLAASTILLPIYATITEAEQDYIITHVRRLLGAHF